MIKKIKSNVFLRNSILYTIGSMMTPMIGFIMLPIYTNYLEPAEYGTMTTVQTLVGMIKIFLMLSLHGAITRFFYDYLNNEEEQKKYLGSIYLFVFLFSLVLSSLMIVFHDIIGNIFFSEIPISPYFFYLIILSFLNALIALPLALVRAQERAGLFISINIFKAISVMVITSYLIIQLGLGAESALISQIVITSIVVILTWLYSLKHIKLSLDFQYIKPSLLFSIPLIPHVASGWIIQSSDRIILEKFVTLDELGIYALAAQVSMVLAMFYTSLNNALVPRYTRLRKEGYEHEASKLLNIFKKSVLGFGLLSIPVAMLGIYLIAESRYHEAILIIPFLLLGHMIKGIYFIPVAKLFYSKRTRMIATSSTIAAILNVVINFMLIPFIGINGAIVSTVIAEVCRTYLIYWSSKSMESNVVNEVNV